MVTSSKSHKLGVRDLYSSLGKELEQAKEAKTFKYEVPIDGLQGGTVSVHGENVVMLASNNYLGLANHPRVEKPQRWVWNAMDLEWVRCDFCAARRKFTPS